MSHNTEISIVVPVWNEENRVTECLVSLKNQDFNNFEVIIIDDGSTDNSKNIIEKFIENDDRFKYVLKDHGGIGKTLNAGFKLCKSDLLTWVSADSWVNHNFLSELKKALDENPDKILAYSNWCYCDELKVIQKELKESPEYNKKRLQIRCNLGPCWLFRKSAKDKAGEYCEDVCEDYYMHLMLSGIGDFIKVPKYLGYWRNHKNNTTNRISVPTKWSSVSVVKAKARWQQAKYKIAYLCPNIDADSVGWLLFNGLNDLIDDFAMRHILGDCTHTTIGTDIKLYDKNKSLTKEALDVLIECDIIHINNEYPDFNLDLFRLIKNKKFVIHLHAGNKQWDIKKMKFWKEQGVDVYTCVPGHNLAKWIPNFVPITNGLNITFENYYNPIFRNNKKLKLMCHHNCLSGKGTIQLVDIINGMDQSLFDHKIHDFMEWSISGNIKMSVLNHLMLKSHIDVCYDTITHGYCGMATWESMAQATSVICRMDGKTKHEYKKIFGSIPPIMNVRLVDDVVQHLCNLIENKSLAKELGIKNREWMLDNYNAEKIIEFYEQIYMKAINGRIQQRQSFVSYRPVNHSERRETTISSTCTSDYIRLL